MYNRKTQRTLTVGEHWAGVRYSYRTQPRPKAMLRLAGYWLADLFPPNSTVTVEVMNDQIVIKRKEAP